MRYALSAETTPGCFEPTGETVDCDGPEEAAAHVAALQAEDPKGRCYAASFVAETQASAAADGASEIAVETL